MKQLHRLIVATCMAAVSFVGMAAPAQGPATRSVNPGDAGLRGADRRTDAPAGLPESPVVKVMAIGSFPRRPTNDQLKAILPGEMSETGWLYLDGKIDQWYVRRDQSGVVFIMNTTSVDEANRWLSVLPLAKAHLMTFEFIPLGPLQPLRTLLQPRLSR